MNVEFEFATTTAEDFGSGDSLNSNTTCRWCLSEDIIGPVLAFFISIEFLLSLTANAFILIQTLRNGVRALAKSSILLLFNLSLSNLLMTLLFMPFVIVSAASGEWAVGSPELVREGLCQFVGFTCAYTTSISVHTLAAISFDRFLSIVWPQQHRKYMTWKVSLGIVIFMWVYSILLCLTPYYGPGLGAYMWSPSVSVCIPNWMSNKYYLIFLCVIVTIPLVIIIVTSVWTFVFIKGFLKRDLKRQTGTLTKREKTAHKSVYSVRIRNLVGIFGVLLLCNVVTWSPYFLTSLVGLIIGLERIPDVVFTCVFVLFLLSNISNAFIQIYFRKELFEVVAMLWKKLFCCRFSSSSSGSGHEGSQESEFKRINIEMLDGGTTGVVLDST